MTVTLRDPSDLTTLRGLVGTEAGAGQRDRCRAVLLAAEGDGGGASVLARGREGTFSRPPSIQS